MSCRILVILHSDHSRAIIHSRAIQYASYSFTLAEEKFIWKPKFELIERARESKTWKFPSQRPAPQIRARILTSTEPYQKQVDDFQFNIVEMTAWLERKLVLKI